VQFSSGLNYLIDIENTVIAMWWLRLHTYDEVAASSARASNVDSFEPAPSHGLGSPFDDTVADWSSRVSPRPLPA
jgi:hypothetical protein